MNLNDMLPFLVPLILAEVVLLVITLRHILTHEHYKRGNRIFWIIFVIIGMQFWGPILYFVLGREEV